MKTVLATVATGKHGANWKRYLEPSWRAYAGRQTDVWLTSFVKLEKGRIGFDKKRLERLVREVALPRYFGGKPGRKAGHARKPG